MFNRLFAEHYFLGTLRLTSCSEFSELLVRCGISLFLHIILFELYETLILLSKRYFDIYHLPAQMFYIIICDNILWQRKRERERKGVSYMVAAIISHFTRSSLLFSSPRWSSLLMCSVVKSRVTQAPLASRGICCSLSPLLLYKMSCQLQRIIEQ